jgi:hypothetical protein
VHARRERQLEVLGQLPTGVTGIPRLPEWDAVALVELPELEGSPLAELELEAEPGGRVSVSAAEGVPREAVERLAAELDARLDRPWEALAVRRDGSLWAAGVNAVRRGEPLDLGDLPATTIELVRAPGGDTTLSIDGEELEPGEEAPFAVAAAELDCVGSGRFESFVARADRGAGGRWHVTVDPL